MCPCGRGHPYLNFEGTIMGIGKILPKRFSSRLFFMTLTAGLIPIVIFSFLIGIYGREFQHEIRNTIRQTYDEEWAHSRTLLTNLGELSLRQRAQDVAVQLDLTLQSHPYMTLEDLRHDRKFRELALQSDGQTGYTALYDSATDIIYFHKDPKLEGIALQSLEGKAPALGSIVRQGRNGGKSSGYYEWREAKGEVKQKYMCIVPLDQETEDGIRLSVMVTAYVEELERYCQKDSAPAFSS
jgi:hypothetical protein